MSGFKHGWIRQWSLLLSLSCFLCVSYLSPPLIWLHSWECPPYLWQRWPPDASAYLVSGVHSFSTTRVSVLKAWAKALGILCWPSLGHQPILEPVMGEVGNLVGVSHHWSRGVGPDLKSCTRGRSRCLHKQKLGIVVWIGDDPAKAIRAC